MSLITDEALTESFRLRRIFLAPAKQVLALDRLNTLYAACSAFDGPEFASMVLAMLKIKVIIKGDTFQSISEEGPVVVICNHPFGLLDGLVIIKLMGERFSEFKILANYLLGTIAPLERQFICVNSFDDLGDRRANLANIREVFNQTRRGASIVLFPAGDVSCFRWGRLAVEDRDWQPACAKLIKLINLPILPVYIYGTNSIAYHFLNGIHHKLGLLRLPRELLNKTGHSVVVSTGKLFRINADGKAGSIANLSEILRSKVYALRSRTAEPIDRNEDFV